MEDNNNTYELSPVEREYIETLLSTQRRVEAEMMGALAVLCKQNGLEPSRTFYKNGCLNGPVQRAAPASLPLPLISEG